MIVVTPPSRKAFSSALVQDADWRRAASSAAERVRADLGGRPCDLAVAFVSEPYRSLEAAELAGLLSKELPGAVLLGCNAAGVIGPGREIEHAPAVSLLGMNLPGVRLQPFTFSPGDLATLSTGDQLLRALDLYPTERPNFLCLADPLTCDVDRLLKVFNEGYPGRPLVGGLSSGAAAGGAGWIFSEGEILSEGAAGVCLWGDLEVDTVVSQGCRPVGACFLVTKSDRHVLRQLGGRPAFEVLRELVESLSPDDRRLAKHSLMAGIAMEEKRGGLQPGNFFIRNLIGVDPADGAVMVGASVRPGQTLQFHLRDARAAAEDLEAMLGKVPAEGASPRAGLLFSCLGRGKGLFGAADHDIKMIESRLGPMAVAGFFANGELGPVGGRNYVHGYTSSLALLS